MLSNPDGDVILSNPAEAVIIINANDNPYGVLGMRSPDLISPPTVQINEDTETDISFTVVRTAGEHNIVSVDWEIIRNDSGSGDVALDLTPVRGTIVFADGERERPILVNVVTETVPEAAEQFILRLLPETVTGGAKVEGIIHGVIIIEDSDNVYGEVQFDVDEKQKLIMVCD